MTAPVSYKRHRYPGEIIARAVWLCFRFLLSLRLIEEMLLERGIVVSYETIRRWGQQFGPDSTMGRFTAAPSAPGKACRSQAYPLTHPDRYGVG